MGPRLVHLEPVLRQLRPGQLGVDLDRQRLEHLHRVVEHRRRGRPSAVGLQARAAARRSPAGLQSLRLVCARLARVSRSVRGRAVGPAVGNPQLRALQGADGQHERHEPLFRTGWQPPVTRALSARPQLHAGSSLPQAVSRRNHRVRVQRIQQADAVQHLGERARGKLHAAAVVLQSAPARGDVPVRLLKRLGASGLRLGGNPPGLRPAP